MSFIKAYIKLTVTCTESTLLQPRSLPFGMVKTEETIPKIISYAKPTRVFFFMNSNHNVNNNTLNIIHDIAFRVVSP